MTIHGDPSRLDRSDDWLEVPFSRSQLVARAGALGLSLASVEAALPALASAQRKPAGQLVFATRMSELADLHPFTARLSRATALSYQINEGLTRFGPDLSILPGLATSWTVSKNQLVYTFRLRSGVRWHDGRPFTSQDVKFTFGAAVLGNSQSPARAILSQFVRRLSVSGNTVRITLREPYSPLLSVLAQQLQIVPAHLLRGDVYNAAFRRRPVGTGPFQITSQASDSITVSANQRYWGRKPFTERIVLKDAPETSAQLAGLRAGELDVVAYVPAAMAGLRASGYPVYGGAATSVHGLCLDLQNPILRDVRVRRALALALDRERIKRLHYTDGILASSYVSTAYGPYHNLKVAKINRNLGQANDLLDRAGWRRGSDGVRRKDGERLELTHYAWPAQQWQDIAAIAQASWKEIGVDVRIVRADNAQIATVISGRYDVAPLGLGLTSDPIVGLDRLLRTTTATFRDGTTLNVFHYSNRSVDALLDEAIATADAARRIALAQRIQVLAQDGMPFIPVAYPALALMTQRGTELFERRRGLSGIGVGYFMTHWRKRG